MIKPKIYIGIDPDLVKSGVAIWYRESKTLEIQLMSFYELVKHLEYRSTNYANGDVKVIVEAGWMNAKANHHHRTGQSAAVRERVAKNVGENHAVGKLIVEVCKNLKVLHEVSKPRSAKTTPAFFEKLTGTLVKNQEMIDAAMLVFGL